MTGLRRSVLRMHCRASLYLLYTSFKLHRFFSHTPSYPSHSSLNHLIQHDHQTLLNAELDQQNPSHAQRRPDGFERITGEVLEWYAKSRAKSWTRTGNFSELERISQEVWMLGHKAWDEAVTYSNANESSITDLYPEKEKTDPCPISVEMNGDEGEVRKNGERLVLLPCGLAVGSSITIIGTPQNAHEEFIPQLAKMRDGNGTVLVSQFVVELQGLKAVDGEEPPKILHLNPRIRGDWSEKPVIEHNTCYRMSWRKAMRCSGVLSKDIEETVVPTRSDPATISLTLNGIWVPEIQKSCGGPNNNERVSEVVVICCCLY